MLIFDQLKREDPALRYISFGVLGGIAMLLVGLWWVQVVSSTRYEANLKNQSFRSVRIPALRGKILDRNNQSLAENRPRFDVNLYLEDLRPQFVLEYRSVAREFTNRSPGVRIRGKVLEQVNREARYRVASNLTAQITGKLQEPQILDFDRFTGHYHQKPYIPFPVIQNLLPKQVAIFAENFTGLNGVEMEIQPTRIYPNGISAAHLLGYIQRDDRPGDDEEIDYKYFQPDYAGKTGVEARFDIALRGKAGVKSLLVNNVGYRQREEMLTETEQGKNLKLTIDLGIQRATEKALAAAMANVRGAAVVMDVRNGDVLALVSVPAFDPNLFPSGISTEDWSRLNNEKRSYIFNRATYGAYAPGSILKILIALACLESGVMNPQEIYQVQIDPQNSPKGCIYVGGRKIRDTANAGDYDFNRAFLKSSNSYFIHYGLRAGLKKLVEVGERFHLGEVTGIFPREEVPGTFPPPSGNVPNLCMGQEVTVTPLQIAVMTSAIANGGKLFSPRIIKGLQSPDVELEPEISPFQPGVLRSDLRLNPKHVDIIHRAMLADVEDPEGTGRSAAISGFRIAGKTGTAQVALRNQEFDHITWFVSFAPFDEPKYAVVVMVQSGASGGGTCAPVARKIYETILKLEQTGPAPSSTLARLN